MSDSNPSEHTFQRTITWRDPTPDLAQARTLSGLDYLRAIADGRFAPPPIAVLMDFQLVEIDKGLAVFTVVPQPSHYNPIGSVHGGLAATILDSAMACAVHSTLGAGQAYTTVELHINYVRAIQAETGLLRCEGRTIHVGRRLATAEGRLVDKRGKLYAHGTTTCLVITPPTTLTADL